MPCPCPCPCPGEESGDEDELSKNEPTEPGGIENLTSERTGIKIIPLFESAITFIKGSKVDNEVGAAAAAAEAGPARTPAPSPCPRLSKLRIFSGILICLILIACFFLFGSGSI